MKYALLVFQPHEKFDRRDSAMAAAGKAYGEALRDAGVVVTAAGFTRFRRVAETPFNTVFEARP